MNRFSTSKSVIHQGLTSRETLEKAAAAVSSTLPKSLSNETTAFTPESANAEAQRVADELKAISCKIEAKLKGSIPKTRTIATQR